MIFFCKTIIIVKITTVMIIHMMIADDSSPINSASFHDKHDDGLKTAFDDIAGSMHEGADIALISFGVDTQKVEDECNTKYLQLMNQRN
ncbi:hypothetical protein WA026_018775 [Henosepilachna vigintioctopunctata]|uniref:VWFA domain-containing protein n=1 Tax=Henosepilachna vigintioctopunctata TaxID=420089 RepID=A0AAW1TVK4_9CUCU